MTNRILPSRYFSSVVLSFFARTQASTQVINCFPGAISFSLVPTSSLAFIPFSSVGSLCCSSLVFLFKTSEKYEASLFSPF
jgi:hypothetical protein